MNNWLMHILHDNKAKVARPIVYHIEYLKYPANYLHAPFAVK